MNGAERVVAALAAERYGVASHAQALAWGMTDRTVRRRIESGAWEELFHYVYRMGGAPRTGRQRAYAATLWAGPQSAVSHTTAGRLLRLDGIRPKDLHLTVLRESGLRTDAAVLHRVEALHPIDRVVVDDIPCLSATRTIIDLASMLRGEPLEVAFEAARRMRLTTPEMLARRAEQLCGRGKAGTKAIRELLSHQDGQPALQFKLEVKMARLWRTSALPIPQRQFPVGPYAIDFALPDQMVGVECEGFEFHGNRLQWKRDKRRTAFLERRAWRLLFVTWEDVTRFPNETLDRIAIALRRAAA
jgi:very-short-patch-repair endonuclease